jgi:hypothetical protein
MRHEPDALGFVAYDRTDPRKLVTAPCDDFPAEFCQQRFLIHCGTDGAAACQDRSQPAAGAAHGKITCRSFCTLSVAFGSG